MVKIIDKDGKEDKFDSKDVEDNLKAAGLPERVAKEVAERVEDRVQEGWTMEQVKQETDVELRRLEEDIDRAYNTYKSQTPMGTHNVGEQRSLREENNPSERPRSESKVELRNPNP